MWLVPDGISYQREFLVFPSFRGLLFLPRSWQCFAVLDDRSVAAFSASLQVLSRRRTDWKQPLRSGEDNNTTYLFLAGMVAREIKMKWKDLVSVVGADALTS